MQRNMLIDLTCARIDAVMGGKGKCAIIDLDITWFGVVNVTNFWMKSDEN